MLSPAIRLTLNFPQEIALSIFTHPEVFEQAKEDWHPQSCALVGDFRASLENPRNTEYLVLVGAHAAGLVIFQRLSPWEDNLHVAFLPQFHGRIAAEAIREAIRLRFRSTRTIKIRAELPSSNRPALMLARVVGLRREGVNRGATYVNGKLVDKIYLGVSK